MGDSLFRIYVENIFSNTYPNALRKIERDYRIGKLLKGLVFIDVDSGPVRLSKSEDNVDFRWQM